MHQVFNFIVFRPPNSVQKALLTNKYPNQDATVAGIILDSVIYIIVNIFNSASYKYTLSKITIR